MRMQLLATLDRCNGPHAWLHVDDRAAELTDKELPTKDNNLKKADS